MPETEKNNYPDYIEKEYVFDIPGKQTPERIDKYLTEHILNATRTKVRKAIDNGNVEINGQKIKASRKIQPGDRIICKIMKPPPIELIPEDIPLDIVFEDEHLLVVNKPAGMVTHPGFGNRYGTLVNALLYHMGVRESLSIECEEDEDEESEGLIYAGDEVRPGIVHRLDKDTSGLLVIAKNSVILAQLQKQFHDRTTHREYNAIIWGKFDDDDGVITGDIGRSLSDRKKFAVVKKGGKHAITEWQVLERFSIATLMKIHLKTGRTHQIRVHFSHNNRPLMGDPAYGGDVIAHGGGMPSQKKTGEKCLNLINRQMLHARTLGFTHPVTKDFLSFSSELPEDMQEVIGILREG